jgi:hypothetical protein
MKEQLGVFMDVSLTAALKTAVTPIATQVMTPLIATCVTFQSPVQKREKKPLGLGPLWSIVVI